MSLRVSVAFAVLLACALPAATPALAAPHLDAASITPADASSPASLLPHAATPAPAPAVVTSGGAGTPLDLQALQSMVVDDTNQRVFVTGEDSGGSQGWVLRVYDFAGNLLSPAGLAGETDARGLALSGTTLYVARCTDSVIDIVDTTTLTVTDSIPISDSGFASGYDFCDLAVAGGRLWYTPNDQWSSLTSVTIAAPHTETSYPGFGLFYNPQFATLPSDPNLLVVSGLDSSDTVAFDLSGGAPVETGKASDTEFWHAPITPDGQSLLLSSSQGIEQLSLTGMEAERYYPVTWNSFSPAVSPDGAYVASATNVYTISGAPADVYVFPAGSTTPNRVWRLPEADQEVDTRTAFSADMTKLFVLTTWFGTSGHFHVLTQPTAQTPGLTLSAASNIRYGSATTVTAHLAGGTTNHSVSIVCKAYGHASRVVANGVVGGGGGLSVRLRPSSNTTCWTTYAGDADWAPATSSDHTILVHAVVTGKLYRTYGSSGGYKLIHQGVIPYYTANVRPVHRGACITFVLELKTSGGWRYTTACFKMNRRGSATASILHLRSGHRYRVGAAFRDAAHAAGGTAWTYFKVTR